MKIHEILDRDPRTERLANGGQARIVEGTDAELRAEIESFVCDGQFNDALQRILDRYLANLGTSRQDSAWVSGFFGSGKSHLLKMLAHLWVDTRFQDGATARGLVPHGLPDEVAAQLRELDTQASRTGTRQVAAAGTLLGGTDHVRCTVLSILLRSSGWPAQYPQARFCFWLRECGLLDVVRSAVEAAGRPWKRELNDLYVSPVIAEALIEADPGFASDVRSARQILVQQFPQRATDISTEEFMAAARTALSVDGELPLTVLVLDEVQQYVNQAQDRSATITDLAEAVQTQLDSRVMLVGAGQSALSTETPALTWLRDRFRIAVELTDADVEAVTRSVLLHKKPSAVGALEAMFEAHAGEVARHLQDTRLGRRQEDNRNRVPDYPLLCSRRRFWEACFQAVDAAGSHSQLRSQLRILHDSLHEVADRDVGAVIPASDLFSALAPDLVNTGVLLTEIDTRIRRLDDGTEEGRLRRDLCGLVFLIGKLPRGEGVDAGVRAHATALADLLVGDVAADSGPFRKRVGDTLAALAGDGVLMQVGDEFRLQTTEGAAWDGAFRERQTALRQNEAEIARVRDQLLGQEVQQILAGVRLPHGEARLRRTLALHVGDEPPAGGDAIVVWLRDGWSYGFGAVESEARRLGAGDPTLHVHLPRKNADLLKERIIAAEAARQVLDHYGEPASDEGREARASMKSRLAGSEQERGAIIREVVRAAQVLQGGGNEVFGDGLAAKIATGAEASLARLFPRFEDADHQAWGAALRRARDGSDQPLTVVGWDGATEAHAVAKEILGKLGTGARGSEVQKAFKAAPYGWPQDAIDTVLITLHRGGHLRATRNGQPISAGALDQAGVRTAVFRAEQIRLTTSQRIALRGLFEKLDVTTRSGEEEQRAPEFLAALAQLAQRAGGDAPLPPMPDTTLIDDLKRLAGNEQLSAMHARNEELKRNIDTWSGSAQRAEKRLPVWERTVALREHAEALPVAVEVGPELDAIVAQRSLLSDTDQVGPLAGELAGALREALAARHDQLTAVVERALTTLAGDATWTQLTAGTRSDIVRRSGLEAPAPPAVATDEDLRRTLDVRPLAAWQSEIDAIAERAAKALQAAAQQLSSSNPSRPTTTVEIRRGTLSDEAAVRDWLAEQEAKLLPAVRKGPVILR